MSRSNEVRPRFLGCSAALLAATLAAGTVGAQSPRVGEVRRLPVLSLSMQVGSTEKESRQVVYSPPPGWYVRSHAVDCKTKYGNCSYAVNTLPQDWSWSSEDKVRESYKVLIDLAAKAEDHGGQAHFTQERDQLLSELRKARSTHHALVVEATVRGEGFLKGGAGLQLTVTAEMVYVGTDEELAAAVARHREGRK
jgi:hypothetical protein